MKRLLSVLLAAALFSVTLVTLTRGQGTGAGAPTNMTQIFGQNANSDPCGSWGIVKKSAAVNISTATTTSVVAISGTTAVFVCGFSLETTSGTTPTFQFESGTGGTCATPTGNLTGLYTGAALQYFFYGGGEMTVFATPTSNALCIVSGGTTPNIQGVVTYVQQ